MTKDFWNERYKTTEFVYGTEPNVFFAEQLLKLPKGKILMPADGEGRNSVFAGKSGWQVVAFDLSEIAVQKAALFAINQYVTNVEFHVSDIMNFSLENETFDAIGLVFMHLPLEIRKAAHYRIVSALKSGGKIVFEAFSKKQAQLQKQKDSGGPKLEELLFSIEEIMEEFDGIVFEYIEEQNIILNESPSHFGEAFVIRFIGRKE